MATVKYQQKIHKAFADVLIAKRKRELEEALADKPELLKALKDNPFKSAEIDAVLDNNAALCEYFAVKSEEGEGLEFDTPHLNSVKKTVKTNAAYYRNLLQFINDETDEEYVKLYKAILAKFDAYFSQAAEDILADVYGEQYTAFFDAKSKELAEQKKKNSPKKDEGEE